MKNIHVKYILIPTLVFFTFLSGYTQDFPVDLSKLGPGDSVVISYQATVAVDIPPTLDSVHCQTTVNAENGAIMVLSDDPRTGTQMDPTSIEVAVPTMSQWGLATLTLLLLIIGVTTSRNMKFDPI